MKPVDPRWTRRALHVAVGLVAPVVLLMAGSAGANAHNVDSAPPYDPAAASYVVTYLDVAPPAQRRAVDLLTKYRAASRREPGLVQLLALQRVDRPYQLATVEVWADAAAQQVHAASTAAQTLRRDIAPLLISGFDERVHNAFSVDPRGRAPFPTERNAVYVLTHVDIIPTLLADGYAAVTAAAGPIRRDPGNLAFAAVTWVPRPNHLSLIEVWSGERAFERHLVTSHMTTLRTKLWPIGGSLYDERLYSLIR